LRNLRAGRALGATGRSGRAGFLRGRRPLSLDELREAARRLPAETSWQKAAVETLIDDFYVLQSDLAARVLAGADGATDPLAAWLESHAEGLAPADALAAELRAAPAPDLAMLVVAGRQLRQALG
jgi:glutamate dehydrogenase